MVAKNENITPNLSVFVETPDRQVRLDSALWGAVDHRNEGEVSLLLAAGANPQQAQPETHITLLHFAAQQGNSNIIIALLDAGASIDAVTFEGGTPLYLAIQMKQLDAVTTLMNQGADIHQATNEGATPLLMAARQGYSDLVAKLITEGADPKRATIHGLTPLYLAALWKRIEVIQVLLPNIPMGSEKEYQTFLKEFLAKETSLNCSLNQMISKPESMREPFATNPTFINELAKHRDTLWARLQERTDLNLSMDAYKSLLNKILNSRQEANAALRHPLYTVFNSVQQTKALEQFSSVNILNEINDYLRRGEPTESSFSENNERSVNSISFC